MGLENIPLNWEVLSALGTAFGTGVTGAWALSQVICRHRVDDLKHQLESASRKQDSLSHDFDRKLREIRLIEGELKEARALIEVLSGDLANARPGDFKTAEELQTRLKGLDNLREALVGEGDDVWRLRGEQPPPDFERRMNASRTKVITVVNYKGGVGKTTIVSGLAGYLAKQSKNVLIIDFDYQGSLTRTLLLGCRMSLGSTIQADRVIGGSLKGREFVELGRDLGATLKGARFITCGHTFDGYEFRVMMHWLLGDAQDDVRFRLAKLVLSEEVQKDFDYVLIDAPPRASTGAINALCASHALLVPTVLDSLSVDATASFLARAEASFRPINPALQFAGVIGTLTEASSLTPPELAALDEARQALDQWGGRTHLFRNRIRHFRALTQAAGNDLGYIQDRSVRRAFDALGSELLGVLHEHQSASRDVGDRGHASRAQRSAAESGATQAP